MACTQHCELRYENQNCKLRYGIYYETVNWDMACTLKTVNWDMAYTLKCVNWDMACTIKCKLRYGLSSQNSKLRYDGLSSQNFKLRYGLYYQSVNWDKARPLKTVNWDMACIQKTATWTLKTLNFNLYDSKWPKNTDK